MTYEPNTVIFDHAVRTPNELCFAIIGEAQYHGYDGGMDSTDQLTDFLSDLRNALDNPDHQKHDFAPEILDELTNEAIDHLNSHAAPRGTYFANDGEVGAFGLWKFDEDAD